MKKILVANRGEIAIRVMRSAREMGIKTVAVFSEADRNALHVRYADEAVFIGPPPSSQSYLNIDKIISAALDTGADAIHPGYGFLSENAIFSDKVRESNIVFIGPSGDSMRMMGSKIDAKITAEKLGVPLVPGTARAIEDVSEAKKVAKDIGFPILIKASAGGGGKGMRIVNSEAEFEEQMKLAVSEARSSFSDGSVFIERYVASPRHIEIQILSDKHGNAVHLFERECSVQRRHQKVVEEAPSSVLTQKQRMEMGECAVKLAKACHYSGAGTVEFLLDENMNFYFLEMNTRLQVEHPVTEFITGLDLVKEQIKIARGEKLSFTQEELKITGHSLEIRVYAEDPLNNFLPDIGKLQTYQVPHGPGVRVDDAYAEGMEIPIYYDPMIAKLITYGANRSEAISRMIRAIEDYTISGVATTLEFCKMVMLHPAFVSGKFDTHFVKNFFDPETLKQEDDEEMKLASVLALISLMRNRNGATDPVVSNSDQLISNWRLKRRSIND
ncbi:MAG: acetyl-CoA carboxylase biotin carboxylase subunit [Bacteroidetes bacterium]|nr:MAG: acetyl-CoA carboxylase biotin carboxylase subunit [Bacteroidota bacterium]REJ99797.1 MAG: acetyl-CoA carboxylase biotin carboxylase subunit [Bacteroidota bacterium]REK34170.1 MAG: acetyl-CoA carboxylase biotin carboxylase subunit [Bacteroidota bacterium]REK50500.1 MAG: acetyl-CoA carboxylase biotin carboxylase subunit [Bacteroidota bacterium]